MSVIKALIDNDRENSMHFIQSLPNCVAVDFAIKYLVFEQIVYGI